MTDIPRQSRETPDPQLDRVIPDAAIEPTETPQKDDIDRAAIEAVLSPPSDIITGVNSSLGTVAVSGDRPGEPTSRHESAGDDTAEPRPASGGDDGRKPPVPPVEQAAEDPDDEEPIYPDILGAPLPYRVTAEHQDTTGTVVATEGTYEHHSGNRSVLIATDRAGFVIENDATLEGYDTLTKMYSRVTERDEQGRPIAAESWMAANRIQTRDAERVSPTTRETTFTYTNDGLLETSTITSTDGTGLSKDIYRNVFDQQGVRTGRIVSRSVDINPATGEHDYAIDQVVVYERGMDETWRNITCNALGDGLVPRSILIGKGDARHAIYAPLPHLTEQQVYVAAANPETTLHLRHAPGAPDAPATLTVPSWIPQTAAYDIASQTISLEAAAVEPHFPETERATILTQAEALQTIGNFETYTEHTEACDFINQLRTREVVVLHPLEIPPEIDLQLTELAHPPEQGVRGPLTPVQQLAILAALHPVFSRTDIIPNSIEEAERDRDALHQLTLLLGTNLEAIRQTAATISENLNDDAVQCLGVLLIR